MAYQDDRDYSDPLFRYYEMFCMIRKGEKNAISTAEILRRLNTKVLYQNVKIKTVQRDLMKICDQGENSMFPLKYTVEGRAYKWYWNEQFQFPMMTIDEALAFKLNEIFIQPVLPTSCRILESYYQQANKTLTHNKSNAWAEKIRIKMPKESSLMSRMFDQLDIVAGALVHEKQFSADFNNKSCLFNPLGLLFEVGNATLVTTIDNNEILKLSFFQFENAKITENDVVIPQNFNLDDYA